MQTQNTIHLYGQVADSAHYCTTLGDGRINCRHWRSHVRYNLRLAGWPLGPGQAESVRAELSGMHSCGLGGRGAGGKCQVIGECPRSDRRVGRILSIALSAASNCQSSSWCIGAANGEMNNHDYHMINEDLRSNKEEPPFEAEFLQNYLTSAAPNNSNNNSSSNVDPELATTKSIPVLSLKQSFSSFGNRKGAIEGGFSMKYRNIGKNGLRVPLLAFAAWHHFGQSMTESAAEEVLTAAYENGINFFDTGDAFANGQAEIMLGNVLKRKNWRRSSYIISTKLFWKGGPSTHLGGGLSRKFIIEAVEASLRRLQLKYIDILILNKNDGMCPMEEIVRTMSYLINNGIIFYWGTSRFSPMHISEAFCIARQFNCPPPICEQMQYDMNVRDKMELAMLELFHKSGIGCITWSPISLQNDEGIPLITRRQNYWDNNYFLQPKCSELTKLCHQLGCDMTQLSLAWSLQNENVNCVLITAGNLPELYQKLNAVKLYTILTPAINEDIERIMQNNPVVLKRQKAPSITVVVAEHQMEDEEAVVVPE